VKVAFPAALTYVREEPLSGNNRNAIPIGEMGNAHSRERPVEREMTGTVERVVLLSGTVKVNATISK
jgi:hypothetical protein